ncbi:S9 family peptidase [Rhizobacter sp. LjRoot28]|uniref:S9 family peptidase n=1 Tax=Rhizobacter sp. LjRoot28 TaxID=3342309 RepID=UPI003ECD82FE
MTRPFTVDDLDLHQHVSELDCHAASGVAVFTVRSVDRAGDRYTSALWLHRLDEGQGIALTGPGQHDASPRISPDGRQVAFVSDRQEGPLRVFTVPVDGGEPRALATLPGSASSIRWAPDGVSLVVAAAVPVDPSLRGARSDRSALPRGPRAPEIAWKLPYKSDGIGYLLQREIHLFRVPVEGDQVEQLTDGPFDVLSHAISPDGRQIAFTRTREGRFAHCTDRWICGAAGEAPRRLTSGHATVLQPVWSPDGKRLAFAGAVLEGDAQCRLWTVDVATAQVQLVGGDAIDVSDATSMHWDAASSRLMFVRAHHGRHQVAALSVDPGAAGNAVTVDVLRAGDRQLGVFGVTDECFVYTVDHPASPCELWCAPRGGGDERQLSDLNAWWRTRESIDVELRQFVVPDGEGGQEVIEGWLMHRRDAQGPMPLLNDVHGGPASHALLDFDTNVYWQVLCSQGWAVLALNAVGSSSYGQRFCQRLAGRWGQLDLPQHLAAVRQLQDEGVCDERLAIVGKSYGGYLSSWATGHTDLFKATVVMAPVGNIETHYGTSDGGYYADPLYLSTAPRFDRSLARKLSPLQYIEQSNTPTLFLQGKEDERCPKCQAEELFVSLVRAGDTPAELVLYPDEGHGFLGEGAPACRRDAAQRIVAWVTLHTGPDGTSAVGASAEAATASVD